MIFSIQVGSSLTKTKPLQPYRSRLGAAALVLSGALVIGAVAAQAQQAVPKLLPVPAQTPTPTQTRITQTPTPARTTQTQTAQGAQPATPLGAPIGQPTRKPAAGEELKPGAPVQERQHVQEKAQQHGHRLGAFTIYPEFEVTESWNDNIFSTEDDEVTNSWLDIGPRIYLRSNWNVHHLEFGAIGNFGRYVDNSSENYDDDEYFTAGRLDVLESTFLDMRLSFSRKHEDRGSPDDVAGISPTTYDRGFGELKLRHKFNRLAIFAESSAEHLYYANTETSGDLRQTSERNRAVRTANLRGEYEFFDQYGAFVELEGVNVDYITKDSRGIDRSNWGFDARTGALLAITGLLSGEGYAGWLERYYDDDTTLVSIKAPSYGTALIWNPTKLTTVRIDLGREVAEATNDGASGQLRTTGSVDINHELLRELLLNASASYTEGDFRGIERTDETLALGVGAKYKMNRHITLELTYDFTDKESDDPVSEYLQSIVALKLAARHCT